MSETTLFVTGASGFIGRHLLRRLSGKNAPRLVCLSRNLSASPERNAVWVTGSLADPAPWRVALRGASAVVHLAAVTGKGAPEEFRRANVEGTRALLEAARAEGVPRFCLVSTIAAGYPDVHAYPYAQSKREAEELVRSSGLPWSIVRPTIVLGPRSPLWRSLAGLAKLPLVPAFGGGRARIQPIHAVDVAEGLAALLEDPSLDGALHELGGPEVLTFGEFLLKAHAELTGSRGRLLPLPARGLIGPLWGLEHVARPLLPLTAGQLHAFAYDSTARPGPLWERLRANMRGVDAMLAELCGRKSAAAAAGGTA